MSNPQKIRTARAEPIGDGLAVHDWQRATTFVLNATTCLVWQHCDGRTTPRQLAGLLERTFNVSHRYAEELLELALAELDHADLLQRDVPLPPQPSRRQVIKSLTAAGLSLVLMPVVAPIPSALAATTFGPTTQGPTTHGPTTTGAPITTTGLPPTTTVRPTTTTPPTTTTTTTTTPPTTTTTTTAAPTGGTGTGTGGGSATPEAPSGLLLASSMAPLAGLAAWRRSRERNRPTPSAPADDSDHREATSE